MAYCRSDSRVGTGEGKSIVLTSLVTRLCYGYGVVKWLTDEEKKPVKVIHPLKKKGGQGKKIEKRKIDIIALSFGQFTEFVPECGGTSTHSCFRSCCTKSYE